MMMKQIRKPDSTTGPAKVKAKAVELKKKVSDYRKFLRDDCDFDYSSILKMLRYKLKRTREHIVKHDLVADAQDVGADIKKVEDLLKRVIADKYDEKCWREIEKKFGSRHIGSEPSQEMRQAMLDAEEQALDAKKEDLKKAFDIMLERIWFWWD